MRSRDEIKEDARHEKARSVDKTVVLLQRLQLEVLLDIRDNQIDIENKLGDIRFNLAGDNNEPTIR
jgi:hypothetical protein